jgi:EmrB/QacA subfamily drug resistance transporter
VRAVPVLERKWWALIAVCTAIFMLLLDITIVNVALPDVQRDLDAGFSQLQWIIDAYALTLATCMLAAGSLADLLGRKRVFVVGLGFFTVTSFLCGVSTSAGMLIAARAAQGVGGAIMFATSLALLSQEFHGRERGTAFGIWGATVGAAVAIGPLAGGILTTGLGWRWIFFLNVPIGIAAIALSLARLHESKDPARARLDWAGLVTLTGSLFLLVYALLEGNERGWHSAFIVTALAVAVALGIAFVGVELAQSDPMLDVRLFGGRSFVGAQVAAFALAAAIFSQFRYLTLYLQNVLGYSALGAGLRFLPISLASFVAAAISGKLTARLPARLLLSVGLALVGASLLLMHGVTTGSGWTALLAGFVVAGIGIGATNPPLASTAVAVVPPERAGMASGTNNTFRQVGIATGIAALGAVFEHRIASSLAGPLHGDPPHELVRAVASGVAPPAIRAAADAAFVSALNSILLVSAVVAFAGSLLVAVLIRGRDLSHGRAPAS